MTESEFNEAIDNMIILIEDAMEDLGIDYETTGGVLTITMENGSQMIINRQSATMQLWVAAKSGGYHLDYNDETSTWVDDKTGETLPDMLNRCLSEQTGQNIDLEFE